MSLKKILILTSLSALSFLLVFCSDSPKSIGSDLLSPDEIKVVVINSLTSPIPQSTENFKKILSLGGSSTLLVGEAEGQTAHTLIQFLFSLPDSIKTEITNNNITILSSKITLNSKYRFGDENADFGIEAFNITSDWNSTTFTTDSFPSLSFDQMPVSSDFQVDDSIYTFFLDEDLSLDWLKNSVDDATADNEGLLLSPNSSTAKVMGFEAFTLTSEAGPMIEMVYQKNGSYTDTINGLIFADVSVLLGNLPTVDPENLVIQSSLTAEGKIDFDLSLLPESAVLNKVKLTFSIDTLETKTGSSFSNSLSAYLITDDSAGVYEVEEASRVILSQSGATFTGEISDIARAWFSGFENMGILITAGNELNGMEIFAIKGSNASDPAIRPTLEIVYTSKD